MSGLPAIRGQYRPNVILAGSSWFRVGGPADVVFKPADVDDLCSVLKSLPPHIPVTPLGACSNVIIRDGGIRGVVVRLGRGFAQMECDGDVIHVGAGALDANVAEFAYQHHLSGLEFLCGIPGTIGGALAMNAGAYDTEIADILVEATAVDRAGNIHVVTPLQIRFDYRYTQAPEDWIWVAASLRGTVGDQKAIAGRMADIREARETTQPVRTRTGGSTFKNPEGDKAWQLIDKAGCRGLTHGGARVSEKHCNFLENTGDASAADLETLGDMVRERVYDTTGVDLEWEIKRIGES